MIDLEQIRSRTSIESLVGEKFALRKSGTRFVGIDHDSLVVTPRTGFYFWNSRGEHGDVVDFAGRYLLGYGDRWNQRHLLRVIKEYTTYYNAVRPHQRFNQQAPIPFSSQPRGNIHCRDVLGGILHDYYRAA